ncbi:MAG: hypothetical protein Q4F78_07135 [Bacillota bacterium]|nr:hypothetical protein [Bacillota bacterium]
MKKSIFAIVSAIILMFAMTACGGSGTQTYAGFYSAIIPDGFTANEEQTEFRKDSDVHVGEEEIIQVYVRYGDAEEEIDSSVDYWSDTSAPHQRLDDVTYGDITWFVETYTWGNDDAESCTFYTDAGDGYYIEVNFFLMAYDSEEVVKMMESFTFEENPSDKYYEFLDTIYGE